jgi:hypothetical protein
MLGSHRLYLRKYDESISLGPTYLINPYFKIKLKVPLKKNQKSKIKTKTKGSF